MNDDSYPEGATRLRVAKSSSPAAVAGAIAGVIRDGRRADVHAIGDQAIGQAVRAVALARDYLLPDGFDVVCIPTLVEVETAEGRRRTAIALLVESRAEAQMSEE